MRLLGSDTLKERRSVLDAIEVLREHAEFSEDDRAIIRVRRLPIPSGKPIGLCHLTFVSKTIGPVAVFLPASLEVRARSASSDKFRTFKIFDLNESAVDTRGVVTLRSGQEIRSVEIELTTAMRNPTPLEWDIVWATIDVIGSKAANYFCLPFLNFNGGDIGSIRTIVSLDYSAIRDFQNSVEKPEKVFEAVRNRLKNNGAEKPLSRQKFYDALSVFGMWTPKPFAKG